MRSSQVRPQSLVQVQAPLRFFVASALLLLAKMSATLRARRESLTPAQLRTALPKMMSVIRSRRASLLAELESMGGQAPTTADFPEPSRDELEREANAAALQQLILRNPVAVAGGEGLAQGSDRGGGKRESARGSTARGLRWATFEAPPLSGNIDAMRGGRFTRRNVSEARVWQLRH